MSVLEVVVDAQGANIDEDLIALDFMRENRMPLRGHDNNVSKLSPIEQPAKVGFIKSCILQSVSDEEGLFEIGLDVFQEGLFEGLSAFGLVDVVDQVVVDEVDLRLGATGF